MRVSIDLETCTGYANCVVAAPDVLDVDEVTGKAFVVLERPGPEHEAAVEEAVGRICVRSHLREGVELRCLARVASLAGDPAVEGVRLADGTDLPADAVVVGIGAVPNTEWLRGAGVLVDDGVVCDPAGRTSVPGVWAVGDVARWPNAVTGRHDRVEQWQAGPRPRHGRGRCDAGTRGREVGGTALLLVGPLRRKAAVRRPLRPACPAPHRGTGRARRGDLRP